MWFMLHGHFKQRKFVSSLTFAIAGSNYPVIHQFHLRRPTPNSILTASRFFLLSHLTPYCSASSFSYICCCYEDSSHRWIFRNMIIISSFNLSKDNQIFLSWGIRKPRNKCWFILGQDFQRPVLKFKPITQQVAILKICFCEWAFEVALM